MQFTLNVDVMDADICKKCSLLDIIKDPTELFANGRQLNIHYYKCNHLEKCQYLKNLFESANKTPPFMKDDEDP